MMRKMDKMPAQLEKRVTRHHVPIQCKCGAQFAWHPERGTAVICPGCSHMEVLNLGYQSV